MTIEKEQQAIARLKHNRNAFMNPGVPIDRYPLVKADIEAQLSDAGFELVSERRNYFALDVKPGEFELQSHERSVKEHSDEIDRRFFFALYPVGTKIRTKTYVFDSETELSGFLDGKRFSKPLRIGKVIIFNPRKRHALIYYGELTTFMLLTVERKREDAGR